MIYQPVYSLAPGLSISAAVIAHGTTSATKTMMFEQFAEGNH